jgi:ribosomal protein S18 acetylase RimI-like enzyme
VSRRYEVHAFTSEDIDAAANLRAADHARHRQSTPALDTAFQNAAGARELIAELAGRPEMSGAVVVSDAEPVAYILGSRRPDATWGPNIWIEDAGHGGADPEAIREAYAAAAAGWFAQGRTNHFVVVPANDEDALQAWFSLGFGMQQVHALRDPVDGSFEPTRGQGLSVRRSERRDLPALAELDLVLPRHQQGTAVFSRLPMPTVEETLAELEADFDDADYAVFVAEHEGRIVGTAVGCSLELSPGHTRMMRPRSAGFLGFAAVAPDARGLGAGRAVAEAVMAWSRDQGYEWIATDWRSTNLEANRAWRALGFRPSFLRLHRAIV